MKIRFVLCLVPLFVACQEVEQPTTVLTQEQWNEVKKYILDTAPTPKYPVGANFDNKIELIGFDVEEPLEAGKKTTFTWYWKALEDIDENWKVFVHFDSKAKRFRQNLDHVPVKNMYETSRWKKGQIVKDVQEVTLQGNFPAGKATPYIGWYRGKTRLKVSNDVPTDGDSQPRVVGPTLMVKGKGGATEEKEASKPKYALKPVGADDFTLEMDGKLDEEIWRRIAPMHLQPFGQADKQTTWVKAFLTDDHLIIGAHLDDKNVWGTLKNRDDETWKEEVLEFFLDPNGDGKEYLELQVTPRNTVFDAKFAERLGTTKQPRDAQINEAKAWNLEGLETAVHVEGTLDNTSDEDQFWSVELKLPLAQIPGLAGKKPNVNDVWAMNFYRFDRPKEGVTFAYAWSTGPRGDFHQVDKFGEAKITTPLDVRRPVVTPEMIQQMRRNIDLKVRPDPNALRMPRNMPVPPKPGEVQQVEAKPIPAKPAPKSEPKKQN